MGATCTYKHIKILVNSSLKETKKKAMVISKIHMGDPGPSWPFSSSFSALPCTNFKF